MTSSVRDRVDDRPIDPRIRARRISVRRDEGRRRLRRLAALGGLVVLVGAGVALAQSPVLDVDRVVVTGADRTPGAAVVDASGVLTGDALITVDRADVRRSVERLPWVEHAEVERAWPGTLRIVVRERTPVAVVAVAGRRWGVVDGTGRVLEVVEEPPPELVRLEGVRAHDEPGTEVARVGSGPLRVLAALPPGLAGRVRAVSVGDDGALTLVVARGEQAPDAGAAAGGSEEEPGIDVRFGPATDVAAKLVALATVLDQAGGDDIETVDVRVPSVPVLTRE